MAKIKIDHDTADGATPIDIDIWLRPGDVVRCLDCTHDGIPLAVLIAGPVSIYTAPERFREIARAADKAADCYDAEKASADG